MSIDFANVRDGLQTWFEAVTGLEGRYRETPQHFGGSWQKPSASGAYGLLHLAVIVPVGSKDETIWTYDGGAATGEEMIPAQRGLREITWEVQVWSPSQIPGEGAPTYIARVMDMMHAPSAIATFSSLKLGVVSVSGLRDLTGLSADNNISLAQIDVVFNAGFELTDTAGVTGYVEGFEVESQLEENDGSLFAGNFKELMP